MLVPKTLFVNLNVTLFLGMNFGVKIAMYTLSVNLNIMSTINNYFL